MTQIKDYPEEATAEAEDFVLMQNPITAKTYKITITNFLKNLPSNGTSGASSVNLTFATAGDTNGLFYYLGTEKLTKPWANPTTKGLSLNASSVENGSVISLVNRDESQFYTSNTPNSWVSFNIENKLKCNYYSIRARNNTAYYPRNWKLQGSNDGNTWIDLDTQINNTVLSSASQWLSLPVISSEAYSWFRILNYGIDSEGHNYFTLGEVELYGQYLI